MQTTDTVLMVRPVNFSFNAQTATNNAFQQEGYGEQAQARALVEFDNYVKQLRKAGVNVIVVDDTPDPHTPDSIFPNNWFSTHAADEVEDFLSQEEAAEKTTAVVIYPMYAPNRREERGKNALQVLSEHYGGNYKILDLSGYENDEMFLEGTGSLILDRENKIAYGCISPRTNEDVVEKWADALNYDYCLFDAVDAQGTPIYHTNVMMWIGKEFAVVCLDAIEDIEQRMGLIEALEECDKQIVEISLEQMNNFAGNMLELEGKDDNGNPHPVIVMSKTAFESLDNEQLYTLQNYATIVAPDLEYIEKNGGGSARCMVAEIF